jgi:glutathione S-transferase
LLASTIFRRRPGSAANNRPSRTSALPVEGRNRAELLKRAGKVQVPYLVDPNTGTAMFESDAIREYLLATYAK